MPSAWPSLTKIDTFLYDYRDHGLLIENNDHFGLPNFTISDHSDISENSLYSSMFPHEFGNFSFPSEEIDTQLPPSGLSITFGGCGFKEMAEFIDEGESYYSPQYSSFEIEDKVSLSPALESSHIMITDDKQLRTLHLVSAYVDAMDRDQVTLSKIIANRVSEKVSITGGAFERLIFYLFQSSDKKAAYLKEESLSNSLSAFKTFYQIFPYGKFAHFAANQSILKNMPCDAKVLHIIDFDIGAGVQWASLIEDLGKSHIDIRLTSIKWKEGDFDEINDCLHKHAQAFCVKLTMESIDLNDLISEIKKMKRQGGKTEWLAFNCMLGLPHMRRVRTRRDASKFMMAAKDLLGYPMKSGHSHGGIITFGDGDALEETISSYRSFSDVQWAHYQALLESIEWTFPTHFGEARTALECLFVAPLVSSARWAHKWNDVNDFDVRQGFDVEPNWGVSEEIIMEAKEMVGEGQNLYEVKVEGKGNGSIVLKWSGTTLVKVSSWVA